MSSTYNLSFRVTTSPDFGGFGFYVESGSAFDSADYAKAFGLSRSDIDPQDVHAAQDAASRLLPGEWLAVTHEEVGE